jgi:hypothetical protein
MLKEYPPGILEAEDEDVEYQGSSKASYFTPREAWQFLRPSVLGMPGPALAVYSLKRIVTASLLATYDFFILQ